MTITTSDTLRRILNVIFSITQVVAGFFTPLFGVGTSIAVQSNAFPTPLIPVGYTFSIWGPIYLLCLGYAIYQAMPAQASNDLLRRIGFLTAGAFFFNTLWGLVTQLLSFNWPTLVIIIGVLVCSVTALVRIARFPNRRTSRELWLVYAPIALLAGWITNATFVNVSSVLAQRGFGSSTVLSLVLLLLDGAVALIIILFTRGALVYALAVMWALHGILVINLTTGNNRVMVAAASALMGTIVLVLCSLAIRKRKRPLAEHVVS